MCLESNSPHVGLRECLGSRFIIDYLMSLRVRLGQQTLMKVRSALLRGRFLHRFRPQLISALRKCNPPLWISRIAAYSVQYDFALFEVLNVQSGF